MKKIVYLAVLTAFVLSSMIVVAACGGGTTEPAPTPLPTPLPTEPDTTPSPPPTSGDKEADVVVEITDNFYPAEVTIPVGGRVVWYNKGDRRWWVTSKTKKPDTGVIPITQRMGYTFDEPGEYEYYDLYHKEITGKVIVK